jgi:hypothetical protein
MASCGHGQMGLAVWALAWCSDSGAKALAWCQGCLLFAPSRLAHCLPAQARAQEAKVESVGYAAAVNDATGIKQAKNGQDSVADSSFALATDAPLAAPRGGQRPPSARGVPAANTGVVGGINSTSNGLAPLVSTLPPSARGPLISARGQLSGRIKERPPSARSRLAMGAPPLASARSGRLSTRRHNTQEDGAVGNLTSNRGPLSSGMGAGLGGGPGDVPMSPRDDDTPESPRDGGRDGRLFKYPEWDEVRHPPQSPVDYSAPCHAPLLLPHSVTPLCSRRPYSSACPCPGRPCSWPMLLFLLLAQLFLLLLTLHSLHTLRSPVPVGDCSSVDCSSVDSSHAVAHGVCITC